MGFKFRMKLTNGINSRNCSESHRYRREKVTLYFKVP